MKEKPTPFAGEIDITLGKDELVISNRYETAILFNDFLIALWFIVGIAFFLIPELAHLGAWIFLIASIQFLIRPTIGLFKHIHLKKIRAANQP